MKDTLKYLGFKAFVGCTRLLPWWTIRLLSKFTTFVLHDCIRIRRTTTLNNIARCFPDKSPQEHQELTKQCFRFFSDCFWEIVKFSTVSEAQMKKRITIRNIELVTDYLQQDRSIIAWGGHVGNIDLHSICAAYFNSADVYKKIHNPTLNRWAKQQRERFSGKLIQSHELVASLKEEGRALAIFLFSDQRPSPSARSRNTATIDFFSTPTTFTKGAFILAKRYKTPVIYTSIRRLKLGYHEICFREIPTSPDGNTLQQAVKLLEQDIIAAPETYLWMHKRFKFSPPPAKENAPAHNTPPPETHAADHTAP